MIFKHCVATDDNNGQVVPRAPLGFLSLLTYLLRRLEEEKESSAAFTSTAILNGLLNGFLFFYSF